jgi:hypothetical protein
MLFPFNCAKFLDNSENNKLRLRSEVSKRLPSFGHNSCSDNKQLSKQFIRYENSLFYFQLSVFMKLSKEAM